MERALRVSTCLLSVHPRDKKERKERMRRKKREREKTLGERERERERERVVDGRMRNVLEQLIHVGLKREKGKGRVR